MRLPVSPPLHTRVLALRTHKKLRGYVAPCKNISAIYFLYRTISRNVFYILKKQRASHSFSKHKENDFYVSELFYQKLTDERIGYMQNSSEFIYFM